MARARPVADTPETGRPAVAPERTPPCRCLPLGSSATGRSGRPASGWRRQRGGDDPATKEATLANEAKREAQEALFTAIKDQAETNMKAALRAPEKARLLRELAEAYRLTAGGPLPDLPVRNGHRSNGAVDQEA